MAIRGVDGVAIKDAYYCFKNINYDLSKNIYYTWDNWVKEIRSGLRFGYVLSIAENINIIQSKGGAIWLTSNAELCYRFSPLGKVHTTSSIAKINFVFSNFLGYNFKITQNVPKLPILKEQIKERQDENKLTISVAQLQLVEDEEFNPHVEKEFYQNQSDGLIYRNTFKPSSFLLQKPPLPELLDMNDIVVDDNRQEERIPRDYYKNEPQKSIIVQYLYYLCDYQNDRFFWLIDWLASFFKNLSNRSENILVLYGDSHSGIDILFQYIIIPLFGEAYTLNITDNTLDSKNLNEKLFYNLKNLSKKAIENEKTMAFLRKFLPQNQKYAQFLITTEEPTIPYSHIDNYTVFHVRKTIEEMYIPDWFKVSDKTKLTRQELIGTIASDLENFANILKLYPSSTIKSTSFQNDDKSLLLTTLEDKLIFFVNAIKSMDITYFKPLENDNSILYDELKKDFDKHLIKQSNLIEYFNILYPEDKFELSRTLMKKLRSIDELFQTKNIRSYIKGKKYFMISI